MGRTLIFPTDYARWSGTTTMPSTAQIERASLHVRSALRGCIFEADAYGNPTDPDTLAAVTSATLHQLAAVIESDRVASGESLGPVTSASIGSASYQTKGAPSTNLDRVAAGALTADAAEALAEAGLSSRVIVHG